jgi:hypothetical protein
MAEKHQHAGTGSFDARKTCKIEFDLAHSRVRQNRFDLLLKRTLALAGELTADCHHREGPVCLD